MTAAPARQPATTSATAQAGGQRQQLGVRHAGNRRTYPGGGGYRPEQGGHRPVAQHDLLLRHQGGRRGAQHRGHLQQPQRHHHGVQRHHRTAAVTNLATSNPTSGSVTLTWTAPGDDGSTGTATSYDIRYRTGGTVNDSNWASATQVSGEPTPAVAGTNQSMVVSGLNASTTYYFAIKTSDEVPNTSAISNGPSGTTTAVTGVTTLSIVEKDGVTTNNYPVTLSMGFKQGDVASHVTVRANGVDLPTQTDVKVRWPDNRVRHAMVSFIIPQLQASQTQSIEVRTGGTNQNSTWMSTSDLLATDFQALLAITSGGKTQNASARDPAKHVPGGVLAQG